MGQTFPDVYATTYLDGNTPAIKAADLNAIQLEEIRIWKALRGADFLVLDDFEGSAINNRWGVTGTQVTMQPDASPGGAVGAVQLAADGSHVTQRIVTQKLGLLTRAFRALWRARISAAVSATGTVRVGLSSPGGGSSAADYLHLYATQGTNWKLNIGSASDVDLGVAPSTSYQKIEIRRDDAGGLTVLVDDVQRYSGTFSSSLQNSFLCCEANEVSNSTTLLVDAVKLWVPREPVALAIGGAAAGTHTEKFPSTWITSDTSKSFTFATPFADTSYDVFPSLPYISGGGEAPSFVVTAKSTTGFTVAPSDVWAGSVTFTVQ